MEFDAISWYFNVNILGIKGEYKGIYHLVIVQQFAMEAMPISFHDLPIV